MDIVLLPKNIESYLSRSKSLGYNDVIFLTELKPKEFNSLKDKNLGVLFKPKNPNDFRELRKYKNPALIIGTSTDEKIIRRLLENSKVDGVVDVETEFGRDHTHYRRANVNQVLAKIAKDNGKRYFVDFSRILNSKKRAKLIGRIIQNIRIFRKYKVPISIASFARSENELRSKDNLEAFAKVLKARSSVFRIGKKSSLPKGVRIV
tara:strand:- start:1057 stop:1674 length:618 start_codon:yes stop_codon:yes gene_type:complete